MPKLILAVAALTATQMATADPPTQAPRAPEIWDFVGTYSGAEGPTNVVIYKGSTHRSGSIFEVAVDRNFFFHDGYWTPDPVVGHIAKYKIDCQYHTYYEMWWYFVSKPVDNVASITAPEEWGVIEHGSSEEVVQNHLCGAQTP